MNSPIQLTKRVPLITSLPRRSPATVGRRWAGRAVVPRRRDEGGSLITVLLLALVCFGLGPAPRAFGVSPAPDGAYPGANTAEGQSALQSLTSGIHNTALGYQTLFSDTTAHDNMASGFQALFSNTTGNYDTANGGQALYKNTTGNYNTATGFRTLYSNTTAANNTGNGYEALAFNASGQDNTATGSKALYNNDGDQNTATGSQALFRNPDGSDNTATGFKALYNDRGDENTADGSQALFSNTTGNNNTASGFQALFSNTIGNSNTANGFAALFSNTTGDSNNATGYTALTSNTTGIQNNAFGYSALLLNVSGNNNTAIGDTAGAMITGSGNVCIGQGVQGMAAVDNTTWIRNVYDSVASDRAVYVNSDNKFGSLASSRRYKEEIKPMDQASETILALKPVTFRYKQELDPHHVPMFGLIAEDVEKVDPDLVTRNKKGEVETVRYEAINAMLLNEFLKEHRRNEEQEATIAQLRKDFEATVAHHEKKLEAVTARLEEQAAQIQKVSAQVEVSSPRRAPQEVVANNQ